MRRNQSGFSLVELVVVIMIITSLTALGITSYSAVQRGARNTERKTDLKDLQVALEAFRAENGLYPDTCTGSVTSCLIGSTRWYGGVGCNSSWNPRVAWIPGLTPNFIETLPLDPRQLQANLQRTAGNCDDYPKNNCYIYRSTGTDYKILAHCTPEGTLSVNDSFYDPCRATYVWQVSSSVTSRGVNGVACNVATNGW